MLVYVRKSARSSAHVYQGEAARDYWSSLTEQFGSCIERFIAIMKNASSFHGDIGLLSPANIFQLIGMATLSGKLILRNGSDAACFVFCDGKLNYGFLNRDRRKLGQTLLESRLITAEQLEVCLTLQKASVPWKKLGKIAVENGYLDRSQIRKLFYSQIKVALFEAISWQEGTFSFVDCSPFTRDDIILEENVDTLVFNGLIYLDENCSKAA